MYSCRMRMRCWRCLAGRRYLQARGYEHYEIANYALPGYRCRHNLTYWQNRPYLGLGLGAHSYWHGALGKHPDPQTYLAQLAVGQLPWLSKLW